MPLTAPVQLSSDFPRWNCGMEHLLNESERLGESTIAAEMAVIQISIY